jgi:hypothetical protein
MFTSVFSIDRAHRHITYRVQTKNNMYVMVLPFDYIGYKCLSESKRLRNHRWYSDATWWEMGECCPFYA